MELSAIIAARQALTKPLGWYLRLTRFTRGRTWLMGLGARILGEGPHNVTCRDGRRFQLRFPRDHGWEQLYFLKTFETGTTDTLRAILRADDITFDIGANIGWFTTLFAQTCSQGHCYSFEPLPSVFDELAVNCHLNLAETKVTLNNLGVGDQAGEATIYFPSELSHGYSSVSPKVVSGGTPIRCTMTTVDQYVREQNVVRLDLIKVDVEGAELSVLNGADALIRRPNAPIWLLEVNSRTSAAFGYRPPDLLAFLNERQRHQFFRIAEGWGQLMPMRNLEDCAHADNVLCVPYSRLDRLKPLK